MWGKDELFENCDRVPLVIRVPWSNRTGTTAKDLVELRRPCFQGETPLWGPPDKLCDVTPPSVSGRSLTDQLL